MKVQIAIVELDGRQFGLAVVEEALLDDPTERDRRHHFFEQHLFRELPVVMVGSGYLKIPRFHGRADLVTILREVQMDAIEWTILDLPPSMLPVESPPN